MGQARRRPGLPQEARAGPGVAGAIRREHLDGYLTVEAHLMGKVDHPHAAASQWPLEDVAVERALKEVKVRLYGRLYRQRSLHFRLHGCA